VTWQYVGALDALLGFTVSREDTDGSRVVAVLGTDARQFTDRQLRPERAYTYVVTAFGPAGSAAPARAAATTWRQTLRAPTELTAVSERLGLRLRWRDLDRRHRRPGRAPDPGLSTPAACRR
jgi:hypothetical protein